MVTKKQIKLVKSLQQKKYRNELGLFVVEGIKSVNELVGSHFEPYLILASSAELQKKVHSDVQLIGDSELSTISSLHTSNGVLGVFKMPKRTFNGDVDWVLVLDAIRDPGNLGTIVRLCDWFGISRIVCSLDTVDCYNPKVLQATMGSIARVHVRYTDLQEYLASADVPVFGAFMHGEPIYKEALPSKGILVMGNEANGISPEIEKHVNRKVTIPQYGEHSAESLNVAMATGVLLSEIRRDSFTQK